MGEFDDSIISHLVYAKQATLMPPTQPSQYDAIADAYAMSAVKPDKQYSILPTVLMLCGDLRGKAVLDLGCGDGFFSFPLALNQAARVIGVDISQKQLERAQGALSKHQPVLQEKITFRKLDFFADSLPQADIIVAPFVLNYAQTVTQLREFLQSCYHALSPGGLLVAVLDNPTGIDNTRFGARKSVDKTEDGSRLRIELFNNGMPILELDATYFRIPTVMSILAQCGYRDTITHAPIISPQGLAQYGTGFWAGYTEDCELAYISAYKPTTKQT
jgi:SAM-dependent methyltransferase